jgi:hypothetical protein
MALQLWISLASTLSCGDRGREERRVHADHAPFWQGRSFGLEESGRRGHRRRHRRTHRFRAYGSYRLTFEYGDGRRASGDTYRDPGIAGLPELQGIGSVYGPHQDGR